MNALDVFGCKNTSPAFLDFFVIKNLADVNFVALYENIAIINFIINSLVVDTRR